MRKHVYPLRLALILPMTLTLVGCDMASADPAYIGSAYSGSLRAEIDVGEPVNKRQYGRATAEFKRTAPGKARFTVTGNIRGQSAGFSTEGTYDSSGFRGSEADVELTIDAAGKISGRAVEKEAEYQLAGAISGTELALTVLWRPPAGAPPSPVRGIDFTYTLESDAPEQADEAARRPTGKDGERCTKTRVEQRVFPSLDGGPMTMGMVVVCAD